MARVQILILYKETLNKSSLSDNISGDPNPLSLTGDAEIDDNFVQSALILASHISFRSLRTSGGV